MDCKRTAVFARATRSWLVIGSVLLGFVGGLALRVFLKRGQQQTATVESFVGLPAVGLIPAQPTNLLTPTATRSPKQVVEIQMEALSAYRHNRSAIHQVFVHASPSNRAVTGPLQRFEKMLLRQPYNALVVSNHFMVGRAVEREKVASVLVTTVDAEGTMSVFRFLLSRQSDVNSGCWMTDGVFLLVGNWSSGDALPGVEKKLLEDSY